MKLKRILASILCIAMVLSTMSFSVFAEATIHNVTNDTELAAAISSAVDGDTIKLAAGTYTGGVSIGKNITLEGSVDADGSPTTVFSGNNDASGGYYDYSIYMNKGIIKNIKIIEAWKGIMTEGSGSLTIDNVTMVNIMYGIHIAEAKNAEDTVLIQNSNIDIAWANSFAGGEYAIVMKNNVLTAENPYYGSGYGANLVNTFAPNTNIEDNVFGENAKILIRDEAKEEAVIGTNYYADGFENALSEDCADGVKVETYYADEEMTDVVIVPAGTITAAYTSISSIWGEATGNASAEEQFEIKIYSGEKLIATAALTEYDNLKDGDVYVTWTIPTNLTDYNDPYWNISWEEGMPASNYQPTHVDLWVNGMKVSSNNAQMNGPDNLNRVEWKDDLTTDIPGVADVTMVPVIEVLNSNSEVVGTYESLAEASMQAPLGSTIRVNDNITENLSEDAIIDLSIISGNVNGVTITNTEEDYIYIEDLTIGTGVTLKSNGIFYQGGDNYVYGTVEVIPADGVYYQGYDAKVTVKDGGKIAVDGSTILRYNENTDSGIYIYGDGNDSTIEFSTSYYIGAYSGTFYVEDANVEAGYFLLKNSYDKEKNYTTGAKLELDNSDIVIKGTSDGQDSFIIDGDSSVAMANESKIDDVRDFNILADTDLTFSIDGTSLISATNVSVADGVPFGTIDNGDGTYGIEKILLGTGAVDNPYIINDLEELKIFRDEVNGGNTYSGKYVKLAADINLNNEEWTPIGNSTNKFQGIFDGDNHIISNLLITGNNSNVGLFGFTTNGEIKNLTVENAKVSGRLNVGVVAGTPYTSKYTNINVVGHVEVTGMSYVGGVGGKNAYANWTDVTVDVDDTSFVKANSVENGTAYRTYVGGVIGFMGEGGHTVKNATSNIDVYGSTCDIGGIAGIAHYGNKFIDCLSSGDLYLEDENEVEIGGITGVWNNGSSPVTFENCSFTGKVYIAGKEVKTSISGPSYSDNGGGKLEITAKVTLNGVEKENLEQAILEAKEMTEPAIIDLLGNSATINKAYVLNNNITFKNGVIVFDGFNGKSPDTYDPSGIYYAVMTIGAEVTFDNCILTGKNVTANEGIFVLATNAVMSLINGSELNVIKPEATAVIYSEAEYNGKLVVDNSKININGKNNAVRGMLSIEVDAGNAEINIKNITDNAMRNVKGSIDNSQINIDGAEYGIKNKDFNETLTITNSSIKINNTANEDDNAGIYLYSRENLADANSVIDAKIYVNNGESSTNYCTLTFETNGGSTIPSVTNKEENSVVDLSEYKPEKAGCTFVGWYSDAVFTQSISSVTLDEAKTVYAKWKSNASASGGSSVTKYTLTFDTNGGSAIAKISKAKNTTVDLQKYTTAKEGYSFDGWYADKELSNKITSVKLTEDTTVYAKWTRVDGEKEDEDKTDSTGWKNPFADVSGADWYYENVRYVAENKLMNGTSENTFSPNSTLTRAMLVTVLYRLEGEPATNKSIPFGDVDMGEYYGNAVSWAKQNGIVSGITETEFAPNQNISREQIVTIIYRYAQYKGYDVSLGDDIEIANYDDFGAVSQYAISAMKYGVASGLLKGRSDRTLNPKDNATRAEIAAILQRFADKSL